MSIESVMPSNHLIFCHPFLLLPSISCLAIITWEKKFTLKFVSGFHRHWFSASLGAKLWELTVSKRLWWGRTWSREQEGSLRSSLILFLASTWYNPEEVTSTGDFSLFTQIFTFGCLSLCCQWTSSSHILCSSLGSYDSSKGLNLCPWCPRLPPACLCSVPWAKSHETFFKNILPWSCLFEGPVNTPCCPLLITNHTQWLPKWH